MPSVDATTLKKQLMRHTVFGIFGVCLIISVVSVIHHYNYAEQNTKKELKFSLVIKSQAIEELVIKIKDVADQITSRSRLRQLLQDYNEEKLSRAQLQKATITKLGDAMKHSDIIAGISRFDRGNDLVLHVGTAVPEPHWRFGSDIEVYGPLTIGVERVLAVSAPIRENAKHVGTDIVLFRMNRLDEILTQGLDPQQRQMFVVQMVADTIHHISPAGRLPPLQLSQLLRTVDTQSSSHGEIKLGKKTVLYRWDRLKDSDWTIVLLADKSIMFDPIYEDLLILIIITLFLMLVGTASISLLLRPITGKVIMHTEELKQAQAESKRQNELLLNAAGEGIYGLDRKGRTTFINPAAAEMIGWQADELIGKLQHEILYFTKSDGTHYTREECPIYATLHDGKVHRHNDELLWRKDGSSFPVEYISTPIVESGAITGAVVTFKDISEQKRITTELRQSEARLAKAQHIARIGNWQWDMVEGTLSWSEEIFRIFGLPPDAEVSYTTFLNIIHPDDRDAVQQAVDKALIERQIYSIEHRIILPSGEQRYVQEEGEVSFSDAGQPVKMIGTVQDINQRKQHEFELKELNTQLEERVRKRTADLEESHRYNRNLFETSPIGLALCDMQGTLVDVNKAFADIIGYSVEEVKKLSYWDITPREYEPEERVQLDCLEQFGRYGPYEKEYLHRDGHRVPVLLNGVLIKQEGASYIWSTVEDITERKRTEQEMYQAQEAAIRANQAKSEFLANMSHEIRTPMNGVLGMLHLLDRTQLDSKQQRFVDTAMGSSEMLLTVINGILDFSKMEAGKLELESIAFDPINVAEETTALLAGNAHEKGLELICDIDPDLPAQVIGDPTRLRQVLTNLCNNAIKFTEQGEVILQVSYQEGLLNFSVVDSGIGMSEEQQRAVFNAFTQADTSHTRKYGGTGLGLAISGKLVAAMGGEISVTSTPGRGSEFSFALPLQVVDGSLADEPGSELLARQRILVVDDNHINRLAVGKMLQRWRIEHVALADSGDDALQQLRSAAASGRPYDIALVDMQMPHMDGIELVRAIRADNALAKMHLLMLVSSTHEIPAAELDGWISKPLRITELHNSLLALIGEQPAVQHVHDEDEQGRTWWFGDRQLLLVEDNKTNQEVAKEILADVGFVIDIMENGVEAVEAVQAKDYDVVLMDIQMPVMDGIEAARQIRALGDEYTALPIIAMTAHALTGDSDKSLAAGMNDHITKPINPDEVLRTLGKWITPGQPPAQHDKAKSTAYDTDTLPELAGIDLRAGLQRMRGNWPAYQKILKGFRQKQASTAADIEALINKGEYQDAAHLAHTLKGSSGNIGAMNLYEHAAEMERICTDNNHEAALSNINVLYEQLQVVIDSLLLLEQQQAALQDKQHITDALDPNTLHELLDQLETYLDTDLGEAQLCLETLNAGINDAGWGVKFEEIENALNSFDMDAAKQTVQYLKSSLRA